MHRSAADVSFLYVMTLQPLHCLMSERGNIDGDLGRTQEEINDQYKDSKGTLNHTRVL